MVMFMLIISCLAVPVALGADPSNIAAAVGDAEVTLECAYGATAGRTWSKGSTKLATNDVLEGTTDATKYVVTTNSPDYTLKVKNIAIADAEKYECSDTSTPKSARLVPIAKPTCVLANEGTDQIKFTCSGGYGGDWPPLAAMKDNADTEIGSGPGGTQAGSATTRVEDITVSGNMDGHVLKCDMVLHETNRPEKADSSVAQNNPATDNDKYKCSVTAVKPAGVTITSGGGETELTESDTLSCAASTAGVPTATLQWSDPDGGDLGSASTYTVSAAMVGKTVTCSISNNIGSSSATFPASTEVTTTTEAPEATSQESSGRITKAVMGELGLTLLVALLCY